MTRQIPRRWGTGAGILALVAQLATLPDATAGTPAPTNYPVEKITAHLSVAYGPVNGVLVEQGGRYLAVYGWPNPEPARIDQVLITHRNREVACAGVDLARQGAEPVIPDSESFFFLSANQFWKKFPKRVSSLSRSGALLRWRGRESSAENEIGEGILFLTPGS